MKKLLLGLLAAAVLAAVSVWILKGAGGAAKHLVVGTRAGLPPFEMRGGEDGNTVVGFDVEIAKAISDHLGLPLKIEEMEYDRLLPALVEGKVDLVLAALPISEERRRQVDFSAPYYQATQVVLILAGGPVPQSKDELKGMRIGAQAGAAGFAAAEELTSADKIRAVPSPMAAAVDLMNSQLDAAILDEEPATLLAKRHPELMLVRPGYDEEVYGVAVRKGDADLLAAVNQVLAAISADGRLERFVDEWVVRAAASKE